MLEDCIPTLEWQDPQYLESNRLVGPNLCVSYCHDPSATVATCSGTWYAWNAYTTGIPKTACVIPGFRKLQCDAGGKSHFVSCLNLSLFFFLGYTWFQGRDWLPEAVNSAESCNAGACFQDGLQGYDLRVDISTYPAPHLDLFFSSHEHFL